MEIKRSPKPDKKLVAIFDNKSIHFGSKGSKTFAEGASKEKKEAYIARHRVNENWNQINAGSLSRYVLWSQPSIAAGVKEFKRKFKL
jgi:hypothetical protein